MTPNDARSSELSDILSSAVDRQIAEQRALKDGLAELRDALDEVRGRGAPSGVDADVAEGLREVLSGIRAELVALREQGGAEPIARIERRLEALPTGAVEAIGGQDVLDALASLEQRVERGGQERSEELRETLAEVRGTAEGTAKDVQALAQAMLDLSANLRAWAQGLSDRVGMLAETLVSGIAELADAQREALGELASAVASTGSELKDDVTAIVGDTSRSLGSRLDGVREQLVEADEISRYLKDQADDLDKVIRGLGDVPQRLEGVVAQALRRALTARAGLVREAEKALDRTMSPVQDRLETLVDSMDTLTDALVEGTLDEDLRRLGLRHVELTSRMDDLQTSLVERLEEAIEQGRERDLELARAIDRLAGGHSPDAEAAVGRGAAKPKRPARAAGRTAGKDAPATERATERKTAKKKKTSKKTSSKKAPSKETPAKRSGTGGGRAKAKRSSAKGSKGSTSKRRSRGTGSSSGPTDYIPL